MAQQVQRTLAIVKPDGVEQGAAGKVISRIEAEGFRIAAMKMVRLSKAEAEGFYAVHRGKPFFASLTAFMSSGSAIVMALVREDAIAKWREIMGATNPANAAPGTLRKEPWRPADGPPSWTSGTLFPHLISCSGDLPDLPAAGLKEGERLLCTDPVASFHIIQYD